MKINKWTLGLAAIGLVSLMPGARGDDAKPVALNTALSSTTISGYVDTSAVWNPGTGNAAVAPYAFNAGKQDGFNLDSVDIRLQKALDAGNNWSSGYVAELQFGPDSVATTADVAIRQAYVDLRVPIGNGLELQVGRFDNIIGYESNDSYKNPNWTRSYGYTLEPTEHTGILGTYQFSPMVSLEAGVVDTITTVGINGRSTTFVANGEPEGEKGLISLLSFTAPDSWGFLKGSSLYGGVDWGQGPAYASTSAVTASPGAPRRVHTYVGGTLNTPVKDLTVGGAWDYVTHEDEENGLIPAPIGTDTGHAYAVAGYVSYKLMDKLTLNGRAEYAEGRILGANAYGENAAPDLGAVNDGVLFKEVFALTGTLQYDLWANVISRLEVRWDHACDGTPFGGVTAPGGEKNEVMVAANVIYKF